MTKHLEKLKESYEASQRETATARDRGTEAAAAVATCDLGYDQNPDDAAWNRILRAKRNLERAEREIKRLERHEAEAKEALESFQLTLDLAEKEQLDFALRDRVKTYLPYLNELVSHRRQMQETIAPLEQHNAEFIRMWERANELSVRVGSAGYVHRNPRPRETEAMLLARVLMWRTFGPSLETTLRYIEGHEPTRWSDPALTVYQAIEQLLASAMPSEPPVNGSQCEDGADAVQNEENQS